MAYNLFFDDEDVSTASEGTISSSESSSDIWEEDLSLGFKQTPGMWNRS